MKKEGNKVPKVGDYVICKEYSDGNGNSNDEFFLKFLSENIGQIIKINLYNTINCSFVVEYNDVPRELSEYFSYENYRSNSRKMFIDEIVYFSKNKKDLDMYITANKYNI